MDHGLDSRNNQNNSNSRGVLIEVSSYSPGGRGAWLRGTTSEHNFCGVRDIFTAMEQSENPYRQGGNILAPDLWYTAIYGIRLWSVSTRYKGIA